MSDETDVYTLDVSGALAALTAVREASNETTEAVKEGNESQTESFFKAEAAIELLKEGWEKLTEFIGESMKQFADAEKSERQLTAVAGENAEAFKRQAEAFQAHLGVSSSVVESLQTMALRYGAVPSQVEALTKAVLDYAATGKDATQSMNMLLNSVEQGGDGLKRMGVQYKATGEFTKDLSIATQALADKYGGTAAVAADTYSGSLAKMKLQYEDLQIATGQFIANAVTQTGIMGKLAEAAKGLNTALFGDKDQEAQAERANAIAELNEQKAAVIAKQQDARREAEFLLLHDEDNTIIMGVSKLEEVTNEYLAFGKQLDAIQAKINTAQGEIDKAGEGPQGAGDPHKTAAAVAAQQALDAAILAAVKSDNATLEAEAKRHADALHAFDDYYDLQRIKISEELEKSIYNEAQQYYEKDAKQAQAAELLAAKTRDEDDKKRIEQAKKTYDTLSGFAIDLAKVGLDQLKTLETANQDYTGKVNDANVEQRSIAQATAELKQKYSDQQLQQMSDQEYASKLAAQADADRAGITQQLAAGQAAAFDQLLADALASIGEQAAVKALFETAEGIAATAGIYTATLAPGHYAAAAEYAAVAAAAGVGAYAISQSRGLTTAESDNLTSLNAQNATSLSTPYSGSASASTNSSGVATNGSTPNTQTVINVFGIAGYTQTQQAKALSDLQRQYAKLKTGSGG